MPLPNSFAAAGFKPSSSLRPKLRRLLVGLEGPPDSGKTEFCLSAPGPGIAICLDRGMDPVFDNTNPPPTRQANWAFKVINAPKELGATQDQFKEHWKGYRDDIFRAVSVPECRTLLMDGDSDSWELQRLATFGRLQKVPSILYVEANSVRRSFYSKLWDSGRIILATNKIKKAYVDKIGPDGKVVMGDNGPVRVWQGDYERQGFDDQDYLWQIGLRCYQIPATANLPVSWGVEILKCKVNPSLVGERLEGPDCNFQTLVQVAYPGVPLSEWGY